MVEQRVLELSRDVDAILIPDGTPVTILSGQMVQVTQALGGTFTLLYRGNLVRIHGHDADALGLNAPEQEIEAKELSLELIWAQLRTCFDPEIPVNIVDLGLIYDVKLEQNSIFVTMTLTAPGCGMGPILVSDVEERLARLPSTKDIHVELVFDPPWDQNMMSEAARLQLGMF